MRLLTQTLALWITILLSLPGSLYAQTLSGVVKDTSGSPLPFATILIKGSSRGVTANAEGRYVLHLDPGTYTLICEHVGYAKAERRIRFQATDSLNFKLAPQQLVLKEVVIRPGGEDPAYDIIRHAIRERIRHRKELESFRCMLYSKGKAGLYNTPKRFMGQKIPVDTNFIGKNATLYLSEVVARYASSPPDHQKVEVISTKVSGQSNAYGATIPFIVSFYENVIDLGSMNPRGYISPIAESALHYYKYKLVGTYVQDGFMIDQVRVTPKRAYEPCWAGNIQIVDGQWRIFSTDLYLTKSAQLELLDTFHMQQLYAPMESAAIAPAAADSNTLRDPAIPDTTPWVMRSQVGLFTFNLFGFSGGGSVANIYSDFELNPDFSKNYFGNTTLTYAKGSNKKDETYWDTVRPIPLTLPEQKDYRVKDSLEKLQESPRYQDSVDRANSRVTPLGLFVTGVNIFHQRSRETITVSPLISAIGYNTVEGYFAHLNLSYQKRYNDSQSLELAPDVRYGFSNHHFGLSLTGKYQFSQKYASTLELAGGRTIFQYDPSEPITPALNTAYTLFAVANYMKIYEASFGRAGYKKDLGKSGVTLGISAEWQDRVPLPNTDTAVYWVKVQGKNGFTSNNPPVPGIEAMPANKATSVTFTVDWQPGRRYIEFPERLVALGSKYPTFRFSYTKGIHGLFGSDADYDKWKLSVEDNINLRIGGLFKYNVGIGGFFNDKMVNIPDYNHFNGNQTIFASPYLGHFQLAPYYYYSNTDKFYAAGMAEHHFAGLLTNKIPLFRRLQWYLVGGAGYLYLADGRQYGEVSAGLENIFKLLRVDFLLGFPSDAPRMTGVRFGFKIGP